MRVVSNSENLHYLCRIYFNAWEFIKAQSLRLLIFFKKIINRLELNSSESKVRKTNDFVVHDACMHLEWLTLTSRDGDNSIFYSMNS